VCGLVGWKEWHSGPCPSLGRSVHGFGRLGMEIFPARLTGWLHAWPDACLDPSCKNSNDSLLQSNPHQVAKSAHEWVQLLITSAMNWQ
jgi:hypothetical protein